MLCLRAKLFKYQLQLLVRLSLKAVSLFCVLYRHHYR
jgi:hypothetical protein